MNKKQACQQENRSRSIIGSRKRVARSSYNKTEIYYIHSNLRSGTYGWKTDLQNIQNKENQAAQIRIIIHAIEKCVHLSFARCITRSRQDVLCDPLRDREKLGRALMTSL